MSEIITYTTAVGTVKLSITDDIAKITNEKGAVLFHCHVCSLWDVLKDYLQSIGQNDTPGMLRRKFEALSASNSIALYLHLHEKGDIK